MVNIKHISKKKRERQLTNTIKELKQEGVGKWLLNYYEGQLQKVKVSIAKEEAKPEIFF